MPSIPNPDLPGPLPNDADAGCGDDWLLLFGAVTARLRRYVLEPEAAGAPPLALPPHDGLLDCLGALEQLSAMLSGTLALARQREQALRVARDEVARLNLLLDSGADGERRAQQRALHNELGTLPERTIFRDRLHQALLRAAPARPGVVLLHLGLGLGGSGPVPVRQGAGDALLRIAAARLLGALRAGDLVGRLGGDEFACLLIGSLSRDQIGHLVRRLLDTLGEPVQIGDVRFSLQPSIGVAVHPGDAAGADEMLGRARAAMERARRQRSGCAFVDRLVDA